MNLTHKAFKDILSNDKSNKIFMKPIKKSSHNPKNQDTSTTKQILAAIGATKVDLLTHRTLQDANQNESALKVPSTSVKENEDDDTYLALDF